METTTPKTGSIGTAGSGGITASTQTQTDRAADRAHDVVDRVTQGTHDAVDRVASKAAPALDRARTAASDAQTTLSAKFDDFVNSEDWAESARDEIREHPLALVGIALLAGLIIGRL